MEVIRREDVQSRCASSDTRVVIAYRRSPILGSCLRLRRLREPGRRLRDACAPREVQHRPDEADQLTRDGRDDQGLRFVARTETAITVTEALLGLGRNGEHFAAGCCAVVIAARGRGADDGDIATPLE